MFIYNLNFSSSSLHYLQFSHVRFLVMTPYLCLVFQRWHNQGFIQPQYCILFSCDYYLSHWIKVEIVYFTALALCLEGFAVKILKSISSPLTLYADKYIKVNIIRIIKKADSMHFYITKKLIFVSMTTTRISTTRRQVENWFSVLLL